MSILSGLNLNKMQGLSLDPQGQSKLSVITNGASVLSGCFYSAVSLYYYSFFFSNLKAIQNLSILVTNCEFSHAIMFLTATM